MRELEWGFFPDTIKEEDYLLGGFSKLPQEILCPEYDWEDYLGIFENQRNPFFDTWSCTNFANCNAVETIHKRRYNEEINKSDKYSANMSGTRPGIGNSHNVVAEASRKFGFVDEEVLPFTKDMKEVTYFSMVPTHIQQMGISLTEEVEYGYERVLYKDLYEALQFSPLQVAVDARTNKTNKFISHNHSVLLYGFSKEKWKVFDSYQGKPMLYDKDYPFGFPLRFHYKKKSVVQDNKGNNESFDVDNENGIIEFIKKLINKYK